MGWPMHKTLCKFLRLCATNKPAEEAREENIINLPYKFYHKNFPGHEKKPALIRWLYCLFRDKE